MKEIHVVILKFFYSTEYSDIIIIIIFKLTKQYSCMVIVNYNYLFFVCENYQNNMIVWLLSTIIVLL